MIKNRLFKKIAFLLSLIMLFTSTVNTTFCFIVAHSDNFTNTFVPFDTTISNFTINKNIEHPFGEAYVIPDNVAFDFRIDFGSLYANTTIKTSTGDAVADEKGSIRVSVTPEVPFVVMGIDEGTKVVVTEIQNDGNGFTVKDGNATMEGVVAGDGSLKFDYVNTYTPVGVNPVNVFVRGNKILEGRDWQEGDSFSFKLEQKQSDETWITLGTKTVTYDINNPSFNLFDFSDLIQSLTFDKIGIYSFRMTEVIGDLENVDYDTSVNTFAIRVTDLDMDGKLEINSVSASQNAQAEMLNGVYNVNVTFNNTFVPVYPDFDDIVVEIDVNKTVNNTGFSSIGPEGFEFVLENTNSSEKFSLKSNENGNAVFSLPFTSADIGSVYTYSLSEINDGMTGVIYDTRVHNISIAINSDDNNKLIAVVNMDGAEVDKAIAVFENTYHTGDSVPNDVSITIVADKTVRNTGVAKIGPRGFEFVLENTMNDERYVSISDSNGKANFVLTFTAADIGKTYTYRLTETNQGADGITYDEKVYYFTVTITLSEDNSLVVTTLMNGRATENLVAEFVNTYHSDVFNSPQTGGDNNNPIMWVFVLAVGGLAFSFFMITKKKMLLKKR